VSLLTESVGIGVGSDGCRQRSLETADPASRHGDPNEVVTASRHPVFVPSGAERLPVGLERLGSP
jgi:hypothetical protein